MGTKGAWLHLAPPSQLCELHVASMRANCSLQQQSWRKTFGWWKALLTRKTHFPFPGCLWDFISHGENRKGFKGHFPKNHMGNEAFWLLCDGEIGLR